MYPNIGEISFRQRKGKRWQIPGQKIANFAICIGSAIITLIETGIPIEQTFYEAVPGNHSSILLLQSSGLDYP